MHKKISFGSRLGGCPFEASFIFLHFLNLFLLLFFFFLFSSFSFSFFLLECFVYGMAGRVGIDLRHFKKPFSIKVSTGMKRYTF